MAATQGRTLLIKLGDAASPEVFTTVGGLTSSSVAISNSPPDVTTYDDGGVKTVLAGKYAMSVTVSGSGVAQDTAQFAGLRTKMLAGTQHNFQIDNPATTGGGTYEGTFAITSFEETGEESGVILFSISIESSGLITVA